MSSHGTQLLTGVFKFGDPKAPWAPGAAHSAMVSGLLPSRDAVPRLSSPSKRRTQIWDLHPSLHCSIIGTCLSSGELRRLLVRLKVQGAETGDDHDLHVLGVLLAGRSKAGAKHLQARISSFLVRPLTVRCSTDPGQVAATPRNGGLGARSRHES